MKTPLCSLCLKSDFLCSGCSQKMLDGIITKTTVDISRFLYNLSKKITSLQDITILDIITTSNSLIILTEKGDGAKVVGKNGKIVKMLAEKTGKSIRVLENSDNFEEIIKGLVFPVKIKGINTLYKVEKEEKKIIISKKDKNRVPFNETSFRTVVKKLTGQDVILHFE